MTVYLPVWYIAQGPGSQRQFEKLAGGLFCC